MMRGFIILLILSVSIFAGSPPDLIVINADVRTMDTANPRAEAIAVLKGRIAAVGRTEDIEKLAGKDTVIVNARGQLLLPGFNDAHAHIIAIGNKFSSIDLSGAKTAGEVIQRLHLYERFLPKGRWILGSKLDPTIKIELAEIDAAVPDNPVFVYSADGKSALANSRSLAAARIDDGSVIIEGAKLDAIRRVVPRGHVRDLPAIVETASNYAASFGVTSLQDMHSDDLGDVLRILDRQGKLKTRVYDCVPLLNWAKLAVAAVKAASGDPMVRTGCVKGHYDEEDEANASLARNISAADSAGLQVMVHAIGPKGNQIVLDAMEAAIKANGARDRRFRIEHAHGVRPVDLPRFGRSKIIPSMQPILFYSEANGNSDEYRRLLDTGAPIAFGADGPMLGFSPLEGIYASVNAGGRRGITVEEAVYAYTMGAAFAEFQEKVKGSIEVGKVADMVILSSDIFAEKADIRNAYVTTTFVNGHIVYENKN